MNLIAGDAHELSITGDNPEWAIWIDRDHLAWVVHRNGRCAGQPIDCSGKCDLRRSSPPLGVHTRGNDYGLPRLIQAERRIAGVSVTRLGMTVCNVLLTAATPCFMGNCRYIAIRPS